MKTDDRVELVHTSDPYTQLRPGTRGTVQHVDDLGTVHVAWDTGSSLGLIPGEDRFRVLPVNDCEVHDRAGQCTLACVDLVEMIVDSERRRTPFDPTGCSYTEADYAPQEFVEFDDTLRRVLIRTPKES